MVGDKKYGQGRKNLKKKLKKKKETKIWSKKTAALIITGQVGSYSKNYPVFTPLWEFVKYDEWHCDLSYCTFIASKSYSTIVYIYKKYTFS